MHITMDIDDRKPFINRAGVRFSEHPKTESDFFKFNLFQFPEKFLARKPVQRFSSTSDFFA